MDTAWARSEKTDLRLMRVRSSLLHVLPAAEKAHKLSSSHRGAADETRREH
jgi:hypothetical protein